MLAAITRNNPDSHINLAYSFDFFLLVSWCFSSHVHLNSVCLTTSAHRKIDSTSKITMKILAERSAFLLDFEILQHLEELKEKYNWSFTPEDDAKQKGRKKRFTAAGLGLEVATRDIILYLSKNAASKYPNAESFTALMTFLNQFELMKVEKLQIVNSLPRSMVHLYGLVEECDQRFDEDACESILAKINELVPLDEAENAEDSDEAEQE